jgi:hypothetical protein
MDCRADPPRFVRGFTEISGQFAAWRAALAAYRRDNEASGAGGRRREAWPRGVAAAVSVQQVFVSVA